MILLQSSLVRLQTVHEDLRNVILLTAEIAPMAFVVTEGVRTLARQRELFLAKKSQTMNSRHLPHPSDGLSRAVDLAIWEDRDLDRVVDADEISWRFPHYKDLATWVKRASVQLNVPVTWGGDWTTLKDGPHFKLNRAVYP